jgi:hypothetical protein
MTKWQPPIPAGALCSPDAIAINIALPLLGWCYDQVGRDGWLEMNLHEVAGAIDVPYHTVKKWWGQLEESGFIAAVDKRGRNGMRVRIADAWLDWRSRDAQHSVPIPVPIPPDGDETAPKMVPINEQSGRNRDLFGTEMVPNMVPNVRSNKVLMTPDQAEGSTRAKKRAAPTAKKNPDKERDVSLDHLAIVTYRATFKRWPNTEQRQAIIMAVTDNDLWSDVCALWKQNRWDYLKVENLISRYQKGNTNGKLLRQSANGHSERGKLSETDLEKGF